MSDDVPIAQYDQERIDAIVTKFRHSVENLYRMAYLQGAMDQVKDDRDRLRKEAA